MANEHGLFWDSYGGDRLYNAESMEEWLKPFFVTGVFANDLYVTATSGMGISVAPGYCNINGKVKYFEDATTFTLSAANTTRIDTIVIERNDGDRTISLKVVTGSGNAPTPPVRENGIYQLVIAQISITSGMTSITHENITDTRSDETICGIVATPDTINFNEAFKTYEEKFNEWFEHLQNELDENQAAHLQHQIDNKPNAPTWISYTLQANSWVQDGNTYYYSLENDYPSISYDIDDVLPISTTTSAMRNVWTAADCGGYESTNIIRCHGVVPTIDIIMGLAIINKGGN